MYSESGKYKSSGDEYIKEGNIFTERCMRKFSFEWKIFISVVLFFSTFCDVLWTRFPSKKNII